MFEILRLAPLPCNKLLQPSVAPNYTPEAAEQLLEIMSSKTDMRSIAEAYLERIPLIAIGLTMRGYEISHQELHLLLCAPDDVFDFITSLDFSLRECCVLSCGHSLQLFTRIYKKLPRLNYVSMLTSNCISNEIARFIIADKKIGGYQIVEICATNAEAKINILPSMPLTSEELIHALMLRVLDRSSFAARFSRLKSEDRELCLRLMPLEEFEYLLEDITQGPIVGAFLPK